MPMLFWLPLDDCLFEILMDLPDLLLTGLDRLTFCGKVFYINLLQFKIWLRKFTLVGFWGFGVLGFWVVDVFPE